MCVLLQALLQAVLWDVETFDSVGGSWNVQEKMDSDLSWSGDFRFSGRVSAILRFGATDLILPLFQLHLRTAFFEKHLLS